MGIWPFRAVHLPAPLVTPTAVIEGGRTPTARVRVCRAGKKQANASGFCLGGTWRTSSSTSCGLWLFMRLEACADLALGTVSRPGRLRWGRGQIQERGPPIFLWDLSEATQCKGRAEGRALRRIPLCPHGARPGESWAAQQMVSEERHELDSC